MKSISPGRPILVYGTDNADRTLRAISARTSDFSENLIYTNARPCTTRILNNLISAQHAHLEKVNPPSRQPPIPDAQKTIILDKCNMDNKFMRSKELSQIFFNGRHYCISQIISIPYTVNSKSDSKSQSQKESDSDDKSLVSLIPTSIRVNTDYIFICDELPFTEDPQAIKELSTKRRKINEQNMEIMESLYLSYFGMISSFSIFNSIARACFRNQGCIVADIRASVNSMNPEDSVFMYKPIRQNLGSLPTVSLE
jgi:hypothetical protein